jgi:peptide/nickel transport system substrate-binding protein
MKVNNRFNIGIGLCMLMVLVLSMMVACGQQSTGDSTAKPTAASSQPVSGGRLKIAVTQDARQIGYSPDMTSPSEFFMNHVCLEPLTIYDNATGELKPWLVTEWKADATAKIITLSIRKDVKFHDNTVFDAKAVKWNLDQYIAAKRSEVGSIASVDVVDDYTVRLNLKQWDNTVMDNLNITCMMVSPTAVEKNGKDWAYSHAVGTGPFMYVEGSWQKDVKVIYKKNPNYWQKGKPYLDEIEFDVIIDPLVQLASLQRGEIDMLQTVAVENVKTIDTTKFFVGQRAGTAMNGVLPDSIHTDSPCADVRVRRAVSYAMDVKSIISGVLLGYGMLTNQWGPANQWGYNPNVKGYPYDPNKAKQLLADAGYANGLKMTIYVETIPQNIQCATAIQGYLKAVGVTTDIVTQDSSKFLQYVQGGWDKGLLFTPLRSSVEYISVMQRSLTTGSATYSKGIMHPPAVDDLFKQATQVTDFEAKKKILWEIQRLVYDEYCMVNALWVTVMPVTYSNKLHDVQYAESIYSFGWHPETAWLSK